MPERWRSASTTRSPSAIVRIAEGQGGALGRDQLELCGLNATISRWTASGRLHRVHPGVYAIGHSALGIDGRLHAALRYVGPGAALSHTTAAWWWRLLDEGPRWIHLSSPGRRRSLPEVRVHQRRRFESTVHRGLPLTTVPYTLLDLAAMVSFDELRRALARADYRRVLDVRAVEAVLGRGRPGAALLRQAIERHRPQRARTRSDLEDAFLDCCEAFEVPLPEVNIKVCGILVDAFWSEQGLVVELDGRGAHGTPAQIESDRRKELVLRRAGHRVQRYTWKQVTREAALVAADLHGVLG